MVWVFMKNVAGTIEKVMQKISVALGLVLELLQMHRSIKM